MFAAAGQYDAATSERCRGETAAARSAAARAHRSKRGNFGEQFGRVCKVRGRCHFDWCVDAFGASARSFAKSFFYREHSTNMLTIATQPFESRYTLPPLEEVTDTPQEIAAKQERIRQLCRERNAIILAHHYERPEVQEAADFTGDSLRLSQTAAKTAADAIVFCGVHFMAETAAILCPEKTVLLPDLRAGCSLSASITAEELVAWKSRFPDMPRSFPILIRQRQ